MSINRQHLAEPALNCANNNSGETHKQRSEGVSSEHVLSIKNTDLNPSGNHYTLPTET